jgi:hypothetical protein
VHEDCKLAGEGASAAPSDLPGYMKNATDCSVAFSVCELRQ